MTIPAYKIIGEGPPLVLLHSSMSSRLQWSDLIEQLAGDYRCIAIDLYGYGGTPMPERRKDFMLTDEVDLVNAALGDAAVQGPLTFVCHSYGGAVALAFAQSEPERIKQLILFEPVAFSVLTEDDAGWQDLAPTLTAFDQPGDEAENLRLARAFVDYWNGAGAFDSMPEKRQRQLSAQVDKARLDFQALLSQKFEPDRLAALSEKVTLLTGRESRASAHAVVERLNAWMPQAKLVVTDGGHMAPLSHGAAVNARIIAELK